MSNFDGSGQTIIATTPDNPLIFNLALISDRLYWTNDGSNEYTSLSLLDLSDVHSNYIIPNWLLYGITTFDINKQPGNGEPNSIHILFIIHSKGYHICLLNSIHCSHYCTVSNDGLAVCSCPSGYVLLPDGITCSSKYLLHHLTSFCLK